jgi:hypothetical protein
MHSHADRGEVLKKVVMERSIPVRQVERGAGSWELYVEGSQFPNAPCTHTHGNVAVLWCDLLGLVRDSTQAGVELNEIAMMLLHTSVSHTHRHIVKQYAVFSAAYGHMHAHQSREIQKKRYRCTLACFTNDFKLCV